MPLTFSDHARSEIERRQIPIQWIERVVEAPARLKPDAVDPLLTRAHAPIDEMNGRVLCVVYNHVDYHIVTVFFDRRMRGKT